MSEIRQFNKLVRDKIPKQIEGEGRMVQYKRLDNKAYFDALVDKIMEEAKEVVEARYATREFFLQEVGDLLDVCVSLVTHMEAHTELARLRQRKTLELGTFNDRMYIIHASENPKDTTEA